MIKLQRHCVKQPNPVFSRYLLATRKQKSDVSPQEFLQTLQIFSKNCNFRKISAEEYRHELVRNAFGNKLALHHIRYQLLENTKFIVERAYATALSIQTAQKHSPGYYSETRLTATVSSEHDHSLATARDFSSASHENKDEPTATKQALIAVIRRKYFSGGAYHKHKYYSAINTTCFSCEKIEHISHLCRSDNGSEKRLKSANQSATLSFRCCLIV